MEFNATFFISAISFIIFTILMNKILYSPMEKIVDERENFVNNTYKDAKDASDKSKSLLQDKADKIAKSRLDAKNVINNKTNEANKHSDEITKNAKIESNKLITEKKAELEQTSNNVENEMQKDVVNLAQIISDKILKENIPIITEGNND